MNALWQSIAASTLLHSICLAVLIAAPLSTAAEPPALAPSTLQLRLVADPTDKSEADELPDPDTNKPVRILKPIELDGRDVARAYQAKSGKDPAVGIDFTPEGAEKLKKLTTDNINHRLAIIVDGKLLSAPTIRSAISKSVIITGPKNDFTREKTQTLIDAINASRTPKPNP
ncbi:MAG: protein translocase subunit secF [Phycisphaerales bacterium]|nr:protein translocase subunit secF [Phycisphaerales bacterium]